MKATAERYKRADAEERARREKHFEMIEEPQAINSTVVHYATLPDELPALDVMLAAISKHYNSKLGVLPSNSKRALFTDIARLAARSGYTPEELTFRHYRLVLKGSTR